MDEPGNFVDPSTISTHRGVETLGWKHFGEVSAGMAGDQEARDLLASLENDPPIHPGTILSVEIVEEIEG